ncbi:hypothetical protein [Balneatrix alpica]|uniref:hypothetical protein n=1 Tax=Balneatrix alpica TaxID=75684 RepID=UPI00273A563B|nr:hypothetical protein [Balneatrix alpica]
MLFHSVHPQGADSFLVPTFYVGTHTGPDNSPEPALIAKSATNEATALFHLARPQGADTWGGLLPVILVVGWKSRRRLPTGCPHVGWRHVIAVWLVIQTVYFWWIVSVRVFLPPFACFTLAFLEKLNEYQPIREGTLQDNAQCFAEKRACAFLTEKVSFEVDFYI